MTRANTKPNLATILIKPRWRAAWRYFKWADNIFKWRLSRASCPSCQGKVFISLRPDAFMTRCIGCGANITNLSLIPVIESHKKLHLIDSAWEMSTYGSTLKFLKDNFPTIIESEYFPNYSSGEYVDNILNQDVQNLSFADESLDLITSNQVFEHVPDDIKGYKECYRVLKNNGALIFTVPLFNIPQTEQLAAIVNNEIIYFSEPEYHDSRAAGPNSILTFWHHSIQDICNRVEEAGFNARLVDITLAPSQKIPTKVIYAIKQTPT